MASSHMRQTIVNLWMFFYIFFKKKSIASKTDEVFCVYAFAYECLKGII